MEKPYRTRFIVKDEMRGKVNVIHTDAKADTCDTVSDGTNPCELGLVDGEVRARWAGQALFIQDFDGCIGGE